jgi:N-acetylmuramoyl-L-alanine amidase
MAAQDSADLTFLALTIWREARGESPDARTGVGFTVQNRVNNPGWWGKTISEVVTKKWQYSSMTDPHDPQLVNWPQPTDQSWIDCLNTADQILNQGATDTTQGADSYFDISIPPPHWATPDKFLVQIGRIKFYRVGLTG